MNAKGARVRHPVPYTQPVGTPTIETTETPHEKFRRLASHRANSAIPHIRRLGNLVGKEYYYTEQDVNQLEEVLLNEVDVVIRKLRDKTQEPKPFTFK